MWQRIQTVFLLITIVSLVGAIFLPIWEFREANSRHDLYAMHYRIEESGANGNVLSSSAIPYALTAVFFAAAIAVAAIEIAKFRDRLLQIKLGTLNSVLLAAGLGCAVYFSTELMKSKGGDYGLGLWLPAVAVICNWIAMRFIRRDEKLVRDSDRLR
jgi:hypothetical protein